MNWFSELMLERKKKNQEVFESSFKNISVSVFGSDETEEDPMSIALHSILKHYGVSRKKKIPKHFNGIDDELTRWMAKYDIHTRVIQFSQGWNKENNEPILAFTKGNKTPVVFFPKGQLSYYYIDPKTNKKVFASPQVMDKFETEAITFYRPLPKHKMTMKDYRDYILKNIKISDAVFVILMSILATGLGMVTPYLTRTIMGDVVTNKDYTLFAAIAATMVGVGVVLVLTKATQAIVNTRVAIKVEHSMHSATMMRMLSLPPSFFKKYNTGELNARIGSVTALCNLLVNGVFIGGLSALFSLVYLAQIAGFAPELITASISIVMVNLAFTVIMSFIEAKVAEKRAKLLTEESGVTYDLIQGIQKIRLTGSEKRAFAKWAAYYARAARVEYNPPFIMKIAPAIKTFISVIGGLTIYFLAARHHIDTATYVAFCASYAMLSTALMSLSAVVSNIVRVKPLLEMIRPILEEEPESSEGRKVVESIHGDVELDHVYFKYDEDGPMILNDVSLSIKSGEYVAIVGKTGCGKSTIVRLLLGFETPLQGSVRYDGQDLKDLDLSSLRQKIGSVTQNGALFHADIFHNIVISAPDLSEEDAWEAAKIANIDEDIMAMPMKMNTIISEGQGSISGGQKQRLMIARAVVHKPKILIFDEATSALDNQCQKEVTASIGKLNCTRIVIAHRLSTIKECDRILYIEDGKIVEEGTYDQLVALGGRFKELIERQKVE